LVHEAVVETLEVHADFVLLNGPDPESLTGSSPNTLLNESLLSYFKRCRESNRNMRTLLIESYITVKYADPAVNLEHNHFDANVMKWVRQQSRELEAGMPSRRVMALEDAERHQDQSRKLRAARKKRVAELGALRSLVRSRGGGPVSKNSVHPPNTLLHKVPPQQFWKRWTIQQLTDQFRLRNGARTTSCLNLFDALKSAADAGALLTPRGTLRLTFSKDAALEAVKCLVEFESERDLTYGSLLEHPG
jgi:hypothetical protein